MIWFVTSPYSDDFFLPVKVSRQTTENRLGTSLVIIPLRIFFFYLINNSNVSCQCVTIFGRTRAPRPRESACMCMRERECVCPRECRGCACLMRCFDKLVRRRGMALGTWAHAPARAAAIPHRPWSGRVASLWRLLLN